MMVKLLAYTPNPDLLVGAAAHSCVSRKGTSEILEEGDKERLARSLRACIEKGHESVLEPAVFTFSVEGISRTATHQLVRHRIASYQQQSLRVVKPDAGSHVIPPTIQASDSAKRIFVAQMDAAWEAYARLLELGIPIEDARFVLPHAVKTNITITMNARELLHFFELRCCQHTQWELRALADEMLKLVKQAAPLIFEKAGPACASKGICPEKDERCPLYAKFIVKT